MITSRSGLPLALAALAAAVSAQSAQATESVAGRYLTGMYAQPGAGIVPPYPGFYYGVSNIYYHGEADIEVPFPNGTVDGNVETSTWVTALGGLYVPGVELPGNWTYAVQFVVPLGWNETSASLGGFGRTDDLAGLGDIQVTPLLFGWHNATGTTFFSTGLTVTAPTGVYEDDQIAVIGLNYWTFTPTIGFTHIDAANGMDYSMKFGVDINTENEDTDYYSGAMAHLDISVTKSLTPEFSLGVFAGILKQIEDDDSAFADTRPDGFRGQSIAIGPIAKYKAKFDGGREVDFSLQWSPEFEVENRLEGNAFFFNASGKF